MSTARKNYPLRIQPEILDAMQRWSNDELRSLNAQIEYVLRAALRKAGRLPQRSSGQPPTTKEPEHG